MPSLPSHILSHAFQSAEGTLLCPSAVSACPQRGTHAGLPGRLRPAHPDPIRSSTARHRQGACVPIRALGRDDCTLWRDSGKRPWTHHAGAGTAGSPDIRTQPQAQARWASGGTAPCPTVATSGTAPASRRCCPRPSLARSGGGQGESGSNCKETLIQRLGGVGGHPRRDAGMVGRTREHDGSRFLT